MKSDAAISNIKTEDENEEVVPYSPLGAMLVIPIPRYNRYDRSLWMVFLNDLSYLLPVFGVTLGLMLIFGQASLLGGCLSSVSALVLAFRLLKAYQDRLERRRIAEFEKQYHEYLRQMHQTLNRKRLAS